MILQPGTEILHSRLAERRILEHPARDDRDRRIQDIIRRRGQMPMPLSAMLRQPRSLNPFQQWFAGKAYTATQTYAGYMATLTQPLLWYKYQETSGTNVANAGTTSSADGTSSNVTRGVTGLIGSNEAGTYTGATSQVTRASIAALNTLSTATYAWLFKFATVGAGSGTTWGRFWENSSNDQIYFNSSTFGVATQFKGSPGVGTANSSVSIFTASAWQWLFVTIDFGGTKAPHIYRGISGSASEVTYSSGPTAGSGAKAAQAVTKYVGNRGGSDRGMDGQIDEFMIFDYILSGTQMTNITLYSGA